MNTILIIIYCLLGTGVIYNVLTIDNTKDKDEWEYIIYKKRK